MPTPHPWAQASLEYISTIYLPSYIASKSQQVPQPSHRPKLTALSVWRTFAPRSLPATKKGKEKTTSVRGKRFCRFLKDNPNKAIETDWKETPLEKRSPYSPAYQYFLAVTWVVRYFAFIFPLLSCRRKVCLILIETFLTPLACYLVLLLLLQQSSTTFCARMAEEAESWENFHRYEYFFSQPFPNRRKEKATQTLAIVRRVKDAPDAKAPARRHNRHRCRHPACPRPSQDDRKKNRPN